MSAAVIDASATLAWILTDEDSPAARRHRESAAAFGAYAPSHWRLEVANGLLMSARRGRYPIAQLEMDLAHLEAFPIVIDEDTSAHAWADTLALAKRHGLTLYDAAYLELALRVGLALATFDAALAEAARRENISVL